MLKKIIAATLLAFSLAASVSADVGDVAGVYYATDIRAILNGYEIDSINIGGETLICAEDMAYYGFDVMWHPEERVLHIANAVTVKAATGCTVPERGGQIGAPAGYYYETDIVTYLDGKEIPAYNLGGRTYIHAEAMRDYGYDAVWYADARVLEILAKPEPLTENWYLILMRGEEKTSDASGEFSLTYKKDGSITADGDAGYFDLYFNGGGSYSARLAFYQYQGGPWSGALMEMLNEIAYTSVYEDDYFFDTPTDAEYEAASKHIRVTVNGQQAEKIAVSIAGGNGHRDYYLHISGLPEYAQEEIEEITITISTKGELT
ncbi:MAG: hypothetical protein IJC71_05460 [Clostridia bacterium]|nr:hypothetical protein [Clostridia bacterium]